MADLVFGLKLTADAKGFVGTVKASEAELRKLGQGAEQAAQKERVLARETAQAAAVMPRLGGGAARAAADLTGIGIASRRLRTPMTAMRGQVQQAAFQLGDFAVQVGAGTNAIRAFSLQAPQLLGAFGPIGAVAGAVVAVVGGFAGALFDSGKNALDAARKIDDFREAAARLRGELDKNKEELKLQAEQLVDLTIGGLEFRLRQAEALAERHRAVPEALMTDEMRRRNVGVPTFMIDSIRAAERELRLREAEAARLPQFENIVAPFRETVRRLEFYADKAKEARRKFDAALAPPVPRARPRNLLDDPDAPLPQGPRPFDFEEERFLAGEAIRRKLLLQATHGAGMDLMGASAPGVARMLAARQAKLIEGVRVYSTVADAAAGKTERWSEAADDLGLTFSSSLEDVLVNWRQINSAMDVGRALLQDFLRILVRTGVTGPLAGATKSFIRGLFAGDPNAPGSGAQAALGIGAGPIVQHHRGGTAGAALGTRFLPAALFAGAPRFHEGLMAGEVPAVLRAGERVRTPEQEAALANGKVSVTVNNFSSEKASVSERRGPMGQRDITVTIGEAMARDVRGGGALHGAIAETFGLSPRALPG